MPTNRKIRLNARIAHKNNTKRVTRANATRSAASAKSVNRHHAAATRRAASPANRNRRNCVGKHCSSRRLGALATAVAGTLAGKAKNHLSGDNMVKHGSHNFGGHLYKSKHNNSHKHYMTGKVPSNPKPVNTYSRNAAAIHQARRRGESTKAHAFRKLNRKHTATHIAGRTKHK